MRYGPQGRSLSHFQRLYGEFYELLDLICSLQVRIFYFIFFIKYYQSIMNVLQGTDALSCFDLRVIPELVPSSKSAHADCGGRERTSIGVILKTDY